MFVQIGCIIRDLCYVRSREKSYQRGFTTTLNLCALIGTRINARKTSLNTALILPMRGKFLRLPCLGILMSAKIVGKIDGLELAYGPRIVVVIFTEPEDGDEEIL